MKTLNLFIIKAVLLTSALCANAQSPFASTMHMSLMVNNTENSINHQLRFIKPLFDNAQTLSGAPAGFMLNRIVENNMTVIIPAKSIGSAHNRELFFLVMQNDSISITAAIFSVSDFEVKAYLCHKDTANCNSATASLENTILKKTTAGLELTEAGRDLVSAHVSSLFLGSIVTCKINGRQYSGLCFDIPNGNMSVAQIELRSYNTSSLVSQTVYTIPPFEDSNNNMGSLSFMYSEFSLKDRIVLARSLQK